MNEFFFGNDALQNYFSELLGIIVTILILPIFIYFYNSRLNFTKNYIAKRLLFMKVNDYLEELVPDKFKIFKLVSHSKWYTSSIMTSFYLAENFRKQIESYYNEKFKKLEKSKTKQNINKIIEKLNTINSELTQLWMLYDNNWNNDLKRKFIQLNFNIASMKKIKRVKFIEDDIETFCENYVIIIEIMNDFRNIIINEYKRKFDFTDKTFQNIEME